MTKRPETIDLTTPEGIVDHMATLPTENLRRIAAREVYVSPTGGNIALVFAAEAELILRDAGFGQEHSLEALRLHRQQQASS